MHHNPETKTKFRRRNRPIQGYMIQVAGNLDELDFEWFGASSISNQGDGAALLYGSIPDQAALLRVLLRLNDLGLTILSVKAIKQRRSTK
jgi:hypothetical protein